MSFERFEHWLNAYKHAWESRDPDAITRIFTEQATYQVTPFREPEMYREGIRAYWLRATTDQRNVRFSSEMLATNGDTGICRWNCHFDLDAKGVHVEIDGIFAFTLTEEGLCTTFQEWWHDQVTEQAT